MLHWTVRDVGLWIWHLNVWLYILLLFGVGIVMAFIEEIFGIGK